MQFKLERYALNVQEFKSQFIRPLDIYHASQFIHANKFLINNDKPFVIFLFKLVSSEFTSVKIINYFQCYNNIIMHICLLSV